MHSTHGENLSIPAQDGGRPTPVYAVVPPNAQRGVVVLHEIMGPQPEIERVVQRFAVAGYAAAAPDLFSHGSKLACIRRAVEAVRTGKGAQVQQVRDTRTWLCERTGLAPENVGLIGFCIGGGFALAAGGGWAAISSNYGDIPPAEVTRDLGPTIACFGENDRLFRRNAEPLRRRLEQQGIAHEVNVYADVGHSFLTDGHHPIAQFLSWPLMRITWNPEVAERAWDSIFTFFAKHIPARG